MAKGRVSNVKTEHPKYVEMRPKWEQLRDVLGGELQIKNRCLYGGKKYLPLADTEPDAVRNRERYEAYVSRAMFYNATARTLAGLVGQVFSKPPVTEFPEIVSYLQTDPAGSGVTLEQQAKSVLAEVMSMGRAGLWVDYPETGGVVTMEQRRTGEIRPTIKTYKADDITNWRVRKVGARTLLSLIVVKEEFISEDDNFGINIEIRYREMRLDENNEYCTRLWKATQGRMEAPAFVYPEDYRGNRFNEIPFVFVGIANNDSEIDEPPMYDISCVNLGHFRNSADYEESVHMVGQPTPWMSGLTTSWVKDVMVGKVFLGSRGGIMLPAGGAAGLLQAQSNLLASEGLAKKESQMIALGAKLVQPSTGSIAKTATEVNGDKISEVSTLAAAARNTTAAYKTAFEFCGLYSGDESEIKFELSTDFEMSKMTSQDLLALFTVWQGQGISTVEYRDTLRKAGYATQSIQDAVAEGVIANMQTEKDRQAEAEAEAQKLASRADNNAPQA